MMVCFLVCTPNVYTPTRCHHTGDGINSTKLIHRSLKNQIILNIVYFTFFFKLRKIEYNLLMDICHWTFILLSYEGSTLTTTEAGHHHLRNPLFGEKYSYQLLAWGEELEASSPTSPSTLIQFPALGFHAPHCPPADDPKGTIPGAWYLSSFFFKKWDPLTLLYCEQGSFAQRAYAHVLIGTLSLERALLLSLNLSVSVCSHSQKHASARARAHLSTHHHNHHHHTPHLLSQQTHMMGNESPSGMDPRLPTLSIPQMLCSGLLAQKPSLQLCQLSPLESPWCLCSGERENLFDPYGHKRVMKTT